jgi:putative copper export protein
MSMYKGLLTLHLLGAVIWVGGAFAVNILVLRMQKERNYPKLLELGNDFSALGMKVFMPASIVVLLAGIGLVLEVDGYDFTDFWVIFGLAGIAFSIIVGAGYLGPEGEKLHALTQSKGPDDPEIQARLQRVANVSRFELVILLLVVADMAIKPFE